MDRPHSDSIFDALARLELVLHETTLPENVSRHLGALRASLREWGKSDDRLTFLVPSHAAWVRTPHGAHIDLGRRPALRALVLALVEAHVQEAGRAVSSRELIAKVWPHDAEYSENALNRLYVSLTRLRRLGLTDILVSTPQGWLIGANVKIVRDGERRSAPLEAVAAPAVVSHRVMQ